MTEADFADDYVRRNKKFVEFGSLTLGVLLGVGWFSRSFMTNAPRVNEPIFVTAPVFFLQYLMIVLFRDAVHRYFQYFLLAFGVVGITVMVVWVTLFAPSLPGYNRTLDNYVAYSGARMGSSQITGGAYSGAISANLHARRPIDSSTSMLVYLIVMVTVYRVRFIVLLLLMGYFFLAYEWSMYYLAGFFSVHNWSAALSQNSGAALSQSRAVGGWSSGYSGAAGGGTLWAAVGGFLSGCWAFLCLLWEGGPPVHVVRHYHIPNFQNTCFTCIRCFVNSLYLRGMSRLCRREATSACSVETIVRVERTTGETGSVSRDFDRLRASSIKTSFQKTAALLLLVLSYSLEVLQRKDFIQATMVFKESKRFDQLLKNLLPEKVVHRLRENRMSSTSMRYVF